MGGRTVTRVRALRAMKLIPELRNLCEFFSIIDEVFAEQGAFDDQNIHKSLGRCYRAWLDCRESLDPDFNRNRYRQEMKASATSSPLRAPGFTKYSLEKRLTSEKNQKSQGQQESDKPSRSATTARTSRVASRSHSSGRRSSEYGEG